MSKLTVKSGKGQLVLKKSRSLVGLKTKSKKDLTKSSFVKDKKYTNIGGFQVVRLNRKRESLDRKLDEVRAKREISAGTHVYYVEGSKRPLVATGEIYIIFQDGTSEGEQKMALDEYKLKLVERRSKNKIVATVTKNSPNPIKVANAMQQTSLVKHAEPDLDTYVDTYEDFVEPADHLFNHQWHLQNPGFIVDANWPIKKGADAKVVDAWKRMGNKGSKDVVIAVIDNGFDLSHPDLKGKVYKPYDLWSQSSEILQGNPDFTHGTPCATVALAASNGTGIVGVAPNAKFMPISGTSYSLRATEEMFQKCIDQGADVISCSWGTTDPNFSLSPMKEDAISKAVRQGRKGKGSIVCYAVGNEDLDFVSFYAAHPEVIAVAATTSKDDHASYSNRGREVTVCAPSNGDWPITAGRASWDQGVSWETGEFRYWRDGKSRGNQYKHFGGTSSACPLVAGICALIISVNPDLTATEVKEILMKTADKIGSPSEYVNGHSVKYGAGRVNADKAVAEAIRRLDSSAGTTPEVEETISKGRGLFRFNVAKQEPKGWGVQIGAFAEYGNVLIQVEKLQDQFSVPILVNINELNGKTVYKVVVGAFSTKNDARSLHKRMQTAGVNGFLRNLKDLK